MKNTTKNRILVFAVLSAVLFCDVPAQLQNIIYDGNQIAETSFSNEIMISKIIIECEN
jgi:hypothetical protein